MITNNVKYTPYICYYDYLTDIQHTLVCVIITLTKLYFFSNKLTKINEHLVI